jgi:predicted nucleotidyltransferase
MFKIKDKFGLLEIFFKDPTEHHLREIARIAKISAATAGKYLRNYARQGLLKVEVKRGNLLFSPNTENRAFQIEKRAYNLMAIMKSGIVEYLEENLAYPLVILFGSYAKGENQPGSDIDLFIIASEKKKIDFARFEKKLGADIQTFIHTLEEFRAMQKNEPELANNIINGIILTGYLEAFG